MIQLRAPKLLKVVILLGHGTLDEGTGKIAVDSSYVCTAESGVDAGKFNFGVSPVGGGTGERDHEEELHREYAAGRLRGRR